MKNRFNYTLFTIQLNFAIILVWGRNVFIKKDCRPVNTKQSLSSKMAADHKVFLFKSSILRLRRHCSNAREMV